MFASTVWPFIVRLGGGPRLTNGALALALVGGLCAQGALAAVGDRSPYQTFRSTSCTATVQCSVDFNPAPVNYRVEITNESCLFISALSAQITSAQFAVIDDTGATIVTDFGVPFATSSDQAQYYSALNNQTLLYVKSGAKVRVTTTWTSMADVKLQCKLAGMKVTVR
jgi:hypothetical protein